MTEFELVLAAMNEDQIVDMRKALVEESRSVVDGIAYGKLATKVGKYLLDQYGNESAYQS